MSEGINGMLKKWRKSNVRNRIGWTNWHIRKLKRNKKNPETLINITRIRAFFLCPPSFPFDKVSTKLSFSLFL